jgi:hypothetical protein
MAQCGRKGWARRVSERSGMNRSGPSRQAWAGMDRNGRVGFGTDGTGTARQARKGGARSSFVWSGIAGVGRFSLESQVQDGMGGARQAWK